MKLKLGLCLLMVELNLIRAYLLVELNVLGTGENWGFKVSMNLSISKQFGLSSWGNKRVTSERLVFAIKAEDPPEKG